MGVCCVKQHNQDPGEFRDIKKLDENPNLCKDNNETMNRVAEAIPSQEAPELRQIREESKDNEVIEKTSKNIEQIPEDTTLDFRNLSSQVVTENARVRELEEKLGPFKPPEPIQDSARRETRGTAVLDNNAHYIGQWLVYVLFIGMLKPIKEMDLEFKFGLMVQNMKATGAMIKLMERGD